MYIQHLLATQLSPAIIINGVKHILSKFKIYWRYSYHQGNIYHIQQQIIRRNKCWRHSFHHHSNLGHYTSSYSDHRSISPIFRSETLEFYSSWLLSLLSLITGYNYINNKMATLKFVEAHVAFKYFFPHQNTGKHE